MGDHARCLPPAGEHRGALVAWETPLEAGGRADGALLRGGAATDEVGFTSWSSTRERESLYNGEPARPVVWTDEKDRQTYRYVLTGANWDGTHRALIEAGLVKCGEANRARPTG